MTAKPARRTVFGGIEPGETLQGARVLPLDRIDPNPQQSRQVFDQTALDELTESIREHGILEPILVRPVGDRYQVVAGERRIRAARLAGLQEIPALIREMTDDQAGYATAIENLQRQDLDPEDEARWFQYLVNLTGLSGRSLAERLGKKPDYVNRRLALMQHPNLLEKIRAGELTLKQALAHITALNQQREAQPDYDNNIAVTLEASPLSLDSEQESEHVERAVLDATSQRRGDADTSQIGAWRRRPLDSFMTWVARTPPTVVPPTERATVRQQMAELRTWLERWEQALEEGD